MMRIILINLILFFAFSCASGQKEKKADEIITTDTDVEENYLSQLEQDLVGVWVNESMRVWVRSYNHSDTSFIVDINEENWDLKMTIKPITTSIYSNGTYISEFSNSFDSLIYNPEGSWLLDGDSLIMEDHQATYKYQVFIDGNRAEFKSILDWDSDGVADDEYFGVQRKIAEIP
ncbi:MAG: hypothetical protein U5K79_11270 [Cyclobacteriaceae bacterium]|nr:hypothetical protein [Cyclobacteriaceae bacterium]